MWKITEGVKANKDRPIIKHIIQGYDTGLLYMYIATDPIHVTLSQMQTFITEQLQ